MSSLARIAAMLLVAVPAAAEVSVSLDNAGKVTRLNVAVGTKTGSVWTRISDLPPHQVLNPRGDRLGDLAPASGIIWVPLDDPGQGFAGSQTALVVWPRWDGEDYELVYSVWDEGASRWESPERIEAADNARDDLEPALLLHENHAYLTWQTSSEVVPVLAVRGTVVRDGHRVQMVWEEPVVLTPDTGVDGRGRQIFETGDPPVATDTPGYDGI